MRKWIILAVVLVAAVICMAPSNTTRISSYTTFYTNSDVQDTPDTSLLANLNAYVRGLAVSGASIDLLRFDGGGRDMYAKKVQFIFSHSAQLAADGKTSVFELHGIADSGPRQPICTLALTAGKARLANGISTHNWVDTIVVTNYRSVSSPVVFIDDAAGGDRVASATVSVTGLRYLEGLFTGSGSTASSATAYIRHYNE